MSESGVVGGRWAHRCAPDFASLPRRSAGWRLWEKLVRGHRRWQVGRMIFSENELQKHYRLLLGVESPWQVKHVKLELDAKRVEIELAWTEGAPAKCPVCAQDCTLYDYAPERTWRHLDTMQLETILRARVPRVDCATDGVKTIAVPWAEPGGRFTRLFERFAIDVLLSARSVKAAAGLLGLSWDEVDHILRRAVDMWEPFLNASRAKAPQAELVHDQFHVSAHLNEAVD